MLYETLHSNMFLLILEDCDITLPVNSFTFQYVSINTIWNEWFRDENLPLHSNMFLLILLRLKSL